MQAIRIYQDVQNAKAKTNQVIDDSHTLLQETYKDVVLHQPWAHVSRLMVTEKISTCGMCVPRCCEAANDYELISVESSGEVREQVGLVKEESCCFIKLCFERSRQFSIQTNVDQNQTITSEKKCSCFACTPDFLCCNGLPCLRPSIIITRNNQPIGRVDNPFICCGRINYRCCPLVDLNVYDSQGNIKYFISGSFCQLGACCRQLNCPLRCICGREIKFDIFDTQKQSVGSITNIYQNPIKECCTQADKFLINFPHKATYEDKLLLLHAALMIDYEIFEDCANKA